MIDRCIENWHAFLRGEFEGGLDALLADEVEFHSPIVFTPGRGRDMTKLYLEAAGATLSGSEVPTQQALHAAQNAGGRKFHYTKEVLSGRHAVLEFETEVDGKYVNGVDMITCDDEGRIVEFKVMLRPLQAIQLMHAKMAKMLEQMKPA